MDKPHFQFLVTIAIILAFLISASAGDNPQAQYYLFNESSNLSGKLNATLTSAFGVNSIIVDAVAHWQKYTIMALISSLFLIAIMFTVGKALNSQYVLMYANMDAREWAASFAIYLLFIASVAFLNTFFMTKGWSQTSNSGTNAFIDDLVTYFSKGQSSLISEYANYVKKLSDVYVNGGGITQSFGIPYSLIGNPTYTWTSDPGQQAKLVLYSKILQHITSIYSKFVGIKIFFLNYLIPLSLLIIPLGIFLRSFSFTKRFGATLLALGITGYIVFPVLLHFLLFVAGYVPAVVPSGSQNDIAKCSPACFEQPPTVIKASGGSYSTVNTSKLEEEILSSSDKAPFENTNFVAFDDLVQGRRSDLSLTVNGHAYSLYSCDNTSAFGSGYTCPQMCRIIPFPEQFSDCRKFAYQCKRLYDKTGGACFKTLPQRDYDPDYSQLTKVPVLVMNNSDSAHPHLSVINEDPIKAAVEHACAYIEPLYLPSNIQLVDDSGEKLSNWDDTTYQKAHGNESFCPSVYREVDLYFPSSGKPQISYPGAGKFGCDDLYSSAINLGGISLPSSWTGTWKNKLRKIVFNAKLRGLFANSSDPMWLYVNVTDYKKQTYTSTKCEDEGHKCKSVTKKKVCTPPFGCSYIYYISGTVCVVGGRYVQTIDGEYYVCGGCGDYYTFSCKEGSGTTHKKEEINYTLFSAPESAYPNAESLSDYMSEEDLFLNTTNWPSSGYVNEDTLLTAKLHNIDNLKGGVYVLSESYYISSVPSEMNKEIYDFVNSIKLALPIYVRSEGCNKIAAVPKEALLLPYMPDCSHCQLIHHPPLALALHSSVEGVNFIAKAYIRLLLVPILAIAIAAATLVGLSVYLGGEMFIPAIQKVV